MQIEFHYNTESKKKSLSASQCRDLRAMLSEFQSVFEMGKALKLNEVEFNLVNHDGSYTRLQDPTKQLTDGAIVDIQRFDDDQQQQPQHQQDKDEADAQTQQQAEEAEQEEDGDEEEEQEEGGHAAEPQPEYDDDSEVKQTSPLPKKACKVENTDDEENKTQPEDEHDANNNNNSKLSKPVPQTGSEDVKEEDPEQSKGSTVGMLHKSMRMQPPTVSNLTATTSTTPTTSGKLANQRYVIRLRGLPWSAREAEITDFFCDESVIEVQIVYLTDGRASGEALVEFDDVDSFQSAFSKNRHHIGHRYIEIFKSTGMEIDTAAGRAMRPPARPPKSQYVIRMRGLPYSATDEDVMEFFEVPRPSGIHLIKDDLGRPSGEGFVEFKSEVDAIAAMAKHRHHMAHRYIELFRSSPEELMRALGLTTGWYNSRNGQPQPKSTCILMRGLPYSCTESDITKFFQEIEVTPIRIHRKADGAEAYVEFYCISDTDKAMTRHRNYIGRRYIELFRVTYEDMARTVGLPVHNTNIPASIINSSLLPSTTTSAPTASLSKNTGAMTQYSTPHGLQHTLNVNGLHGISSSHAPPSYHTRHQYAPSAAASNAHPHAHRSAHSANPHLLISGINNFNALISTPFSIYQQQPSHAQSAQHAPPPPNSGNNGNYPQYTAAAYNQQAQAQAHHYAQQHGNPYYQQQYYQ